MIPEAGVPPYSLNEEISDTGSRLVSVVGMEISSVRVVAEGRTLRSSVLGSTGTVDIPLLKEDNIVDTPLLGEDTLLGGDTLLREDIASVSGSIPSGSDSMMSSAEAISAFDKTSGRRSLNFLPLPVVLPDESWDSLLPLLGLVSESELLDDVVSSDEPSKWSGLMPSCIDFCAGMTVGVE